MTPLPSSTGLDGNKLSPSRTKALRHTAGSTLFWLPALCVLVPLFLVALRAAQPDADAWTQILEYRLWDYLGNTALLLSIVTALAIVFGVVTAWIVSAFEFPGRRALEWLLILPLGVPGFVAGAAYLNGLEGLTPVFIWIRESFGIEAFLLSQRVMPWIGAILVLVATLYPYVYLSCRAAFARQQSDLIEAARTLGLSPARAFFRVVLPIARPAITAGAALVAMEAANDYGVMTLFGINTLTPGIFRAWSEGSLVAAMRLALILLGMVVFVLALERLQRGRRGFAGDTRERPLTRIPLTSSRAMLAWSICAVPLTLGFAWPVWRFLRWAVGSMGNIDWNGYSSALTHSGWTALATCAVVVTVAFWLTAGRRALSPAGGRLAQSLASLGYAIPSALLAVGIGALISWLAQKPGLSWLALSASTAGLLFAYCIRFFAVGIQPVAGGLAQSAEDLHSASRTLGNGPLKSLARVDLPILKPALAAAAILCFVDVFKELTLTLVLRPFDFETLATLTFRLSSEGRYPEAAIPALVLVATGMLGVAVINRLMRTTP